MFGAKETRVCSPFLAWISTRTKKTSQQMTNCMVFGTKQWRYPHHYLLLKIQHYTRLLSQLWRGNFPIFCESIPKMQAMLAIENIYLIMYWLKNNSWIIDPLLRWQTIHQRQQWHARLPFPQLIWITPTLRMLYLYPLLLRVHHYQQNGQERHLPGMRNMPGCLP